MVINEINNMSFLTADSKSKMSKVSRDETECVVQRRAFKTGNKKFLPFTVFSFFFFAVSHLI